MASFEKRQQEVEWIASKLRRLVEEEFVRLSDILVVFRTDYEFGEIPELLQSKLSPGSISGFVRVYGPCGDRDAYIFREGHLTLSTIFSAKGYDAPVVFVAGVDRLTTTEQDRALFYVGATRAKHMLYVSGTTARGRQTELLAEAAQVLKVKKSRTQRIATAQLSPGPMIKTVQNIRLGGVSLWLDEDLRNPAIRLLQSAYRPMLSVTQGDCDQGQMRRENCATRLEVGKGKQSHSVVPRLGA